MHPSEHDFWSDLLERSHSLRSLAWSAPQLRSAELAEECLRAVSDLGASPRSWIILGNSRQGSLHEHEAGVGVRARDLDWSDEERHEAMAWAEAAASPPLPAALAERLGVRSGSELQAEPIVTMEGHGILIAEAPASARLSTTLHWMARAAEQVLTESAHAAALRHDATTDELTGAANYRHLLRTVEEWLGRSRPFVLLMIDVDNLKEYNMRFGHLAGSGALADIAELFREQLGAGDLLAKYGGDEFCVLLPGVEDSEAVEIADGLRAAVREHSFCGDSSRRLTVSIGMSAAREELSARDLLQEADALLFHAKDQGRDRTVASEQSPAV